MSSPADRFRQRAAARQVHVPTGGAAPFASFLERHEERQRKSRNKRRMLIVSVAVHVVVFGLLLLLSAWKVEELFFGTTVEVKLEVPNEEVDAEGKPKRLPRTNLGRAVGLRFVVTPAGAHTLPRTDLEPVALDLRDRWQATLSQKLLPALQYPVDAKPLRLRGSVTVLFDINEQGQAQAISVKAPCQHPFLCAASQAAVAAVPKWPVPSASGPHAYALSVDFRFN